MIYHQFVTNQTRLDSRLWCIHLLCSLWANVYPNSSSFLSSYYGFKM